MTRFADSVTEDTSAGIGTRRNGRACSSPETSRRIGWSVSGCAPAAGVEKRRTRAIEKLSEVGRSDLAERAEALDLVLPPKPRGALAAIEGAPDADVLFVGHVGLEELTTAADVWRGIPMDSNVHATWWLVRREDIPPPDGREAWLYDQWAELNEWVRGARLRRAETHTGSG